MKNKKAYFFTADALIAMILILSVIYLVPQTYISSTASYSALQEDVIKVLSNLRIDEVNNSYVKELISSGEIKKTNVSVIEQISEFWVTGKRGQAQNLTREMLASLNESDNVGLWLSNQFIYGKNRTAMEIADERKVAEELISGVETGKAVEGYSARAILRKGDKTAIRYLGGYVGDGNSSLVINLEKFQSVSSAYMELTTNTNFYLYINGQPAGEFAASPNSFTPVKYNISQLTYFRNDTNNIEFRAGTVNTTLFIAGGYIKVIYKTKEISYTYPVRYEFPGIDWAINLYDSFYVPAVVNYMFAYIHYKSNFTTYMNIGNATIFEKNSSIEEKINLTNENFSSKLNYNDISLKTVPLRFGLREVERVVGYGGNADVVLITDLSGSMEWRLDREENGNTITNCSDPALYYSTTKRISLAKCLDKYFISSIINFTGNRVALSAFYGDASSPYKGRVYEEGLTNNASYLRSKVDLYNPQGGTCICCAINDAYKILNEQSNSSRDKYIIVMTDGIPTHTCQAASGCEGTRTGLPSDEGLWLGWGAGCYGGSDDCATHDCDCAVQNANWSSCRANKDLKATVHSIGFGPVASCTTSNNTLHYIAACGKGNYYSSDNATQLRMIYENISKDILNISFVAQTALVVGNISSELYNDSYLAFNYTIPTVPFGNIINLESEQLGNNKGINFTVPENSTVLDALLVSYSANYWTKTVFLNNESVYNLSNYGENFVRLGDPYHVYLPVDKIHSGNNSVRIELGLAPENSTNASIYDKVIYTILFAKNEPYTTILPNAEGCLWQIGFDDGSSLQVAVPVNYTGTSVCNLTSYDENDAIDVAIYNLLKSLDFNGNNKVDAKFSPEELYLDTVTLKGVPYMWFSTAQSVVWR
ncbi:VWA domain-containing protein [Candidatus Pacearchaeota archaeon]|nr:VWA domain-containing protein [Candidatus Pacearchaeota archaeon]